MALPFAWLHGHAWFTRTDIPENWDGKQPQCLTLVVEVNITGSEDVDLFALHNVLYILL